MAYGSGAAGAGPWRAGHGASTAIRASCGETRDRAEREPRLPARAPTELCEGPGRVRPQGRTAADVRPGRRPARPTDQSNL